MNSFRFRPGTPLQAGTEDTYAFPPVLPSRELQAREAASTARKITIVPYIVSNRSLEMHAATSVALGCATLLLLLLSAACSSWSRSRPAHEPRDARLGGAATPDAADGGHAAAAMRAAALLRQQQQSMHAAAAYQATVAEVPSVRVRALCVVLYPVR